MIINLPETLSKYIWFNGAFVSALNSNIHILTHSLHYSGAVFEGEKAYNSKIFKLEEHVKRLINSATMMRMKCPYSLDEIIEAHELFITKNEIKDAYVRPLIFRGGGSLNLTNDILSVNLIIAATHHIQKKIEDLDIHISRWRKPSPEAVPPQVKSSGQYNMIIVAQEEAKAAGFNDALLLDYQGFIAECTTSNIFFVKDNSLCTPIADVFLNGITRQTVIGLAKEQGLEVTEKRIELNEVENFSECFITGTAAEIKKINSIDMGNKKIIFQENKITQEMQQAYANLVRM